MEQIGAVIIAGGKSRRMGKSKALLQLGGQTFLHRIAEQLDFFEDRLLSVGHADQYRLDGFQNIQDCYADIGPIGGLYSSLRACRSQWLLAVSCDMPLFHQDLAEYLVSFVNDEYDAFVVVTRDGRLQPLCAIYSKPSADILEEQIAKGNFSLMQALAAMKIKLISLRHSAYPDEMVSNVNCPEQYRTLRRRIQGPPILAVSGIKNSGKTTFLEGLLPELHARGLRNVAVIKHDGHDFIPDVPGTDSYRLRAAGAQEVAVYSSKRYLLTVEQPGLSPKFLACQFPQADLILLEGGKQTPYPKIEIVRSGVSDEPVCDPLTLIGLYTDLNLQYPGVRTIPMGDYAGAADLLIDYLRRQDFLPECKADQLVFIR